ncbi:hypothetical protein R5W24_000871 [Gemmata sp. JC717]|uniref:hypothetical protein n=1 Tax=Gemmata algarum TaxID=2975278 RepID=UPI0021BACCCF|nr:hypothetical protein [Gemmata algarum]MDY3551792.1 hypothetical protein [Gemmata algarum]
MSAADAPVAFLARVARRPLPVLLGLAVGFLGCCVAGRVAARQQPFKNFVRFHPGIAPESHYYPTYSQTLNLARQHVKPDTTLVIVGGNSVLHGVGQRPAHVWTKRLQELLGDRYVVLNLAMRAQWPNEVGGLIAERLAADGVPVVYVTIGTENVGWGCDWAGGTYPYFFWDAYGKGAVPADPRREQWLEHEFYDRFGDEPADPAARRRRAAWRDQVREERHRGTVDGVAYAADLWTYVADRYRGTIWTPMKYPKFWAPHRTLTDSDPGATIPFEAYNGPAQEPFELNHMRHVAGSPIARELLQGRGQDAVGDQFGMYLADALRDRTLYVLRMEGAYFRNRLAPDDRATYEAVYRRLRDAVRGAGLNVELVGERYEERDYFDRAHLSESGGRKLAADLAPAVRAMSAKLYGTRAEERKP